MPREPGDDDLDDPPARVDDVNEPDGTRLYPLLPMLRAMSLGLLPGGPPQPGSMGDYVLRYGVKWTLHAERDQLAQLEAIGAETDEERERLRALRAQIKEHEEGTR